MRQWAVVCKGVFSTCLLVALACDSAVALRSMPRFSTDSGPKYDRCPIWKCGYNSSELHGTPFHNLNLDGLPNDQDIRLTGLIPPKWTNTPYTLDVAADQLIASAKDAEDLHGHALIGARLTLLVQGLPAEIRIDDVRSEPSWAAKGAPVLSYKFSVRYLDSPQDFVNICDAGQKSEDTAFAVVLGGERYDSHTITVHPSPRWFSLACSTTALAKTALLGYGPQTLFPGEDVPASPQQRQATLKMLTADYCGVGHSYTEEHVPIHLTNQSGTVAPPLPVKLGALEAIWTEDGALCLDETRLGLKADLCDLPSCEGLELDDTDAEWITHLPS